MRYSSEIGGNKNTNYKIFEWPSNEFLNGLSKDELENFNIKEIEWMKGTHHGPQEDFCNSLRFMSSIGLKSPSFSDKTEPSD
jgi:hypothetical protein